MADKVNDMDIENSDVNGIDDVERLGFVSSLELPVVAPSLIPRFKTLRATALKTMEADGDSALVTGNSVVSFVGGLSEQLKQDVQDGVLFAQLAVDKKYPNKDTHRVERFNYYNEILSKCGWTTTGEAMHKVTGLKQAFTMDQVALEIIASVVGPNKMILDVLAQVLNALKDTPKALNLFENETKGVNSGNFQILPCIATRDGGVLMIKTCMQFKSSSRVTRVLFWKWNHSNVDLYAAASNSTLNQRQYAVVRQTIINKLEASGKNYIENIEL